MQAVRKLTEYAEATAKAAELISNARDCLRAFTELSAYDSQKVFGHTVGDLRQMIVTVDGLLRDLCFDGQKIEYVANEAGFGKEALQVIRAAHIKLRVVRTLASVLAGDRNALDAEGDEVRSEVNRAFEAQAKTRGERWTTEEREGFGEGSRAFSPDFEARLSGS